jgi:GLPGLI family protein
MDMYNMRMKIFLLLLASCPALIFSQKENPQVQYDCKYSIKFINDTIKMTYGRKDEFILKTGENFSYGYSYLDFYRDSLMTSPHGGIIFANSLLDEFKSGSLSSMSDFYGSTISAAKLYKNYTKRRITVWDNISVHWFTYEEELIPQKWTVLEDTMTIAGYQCQKAVCDFRGRSYEAWFTSEIPINEGPWKFYGLPGLIVKIYDTKHHYDFELIEIKQTDEKIDARLLSTKKLVRFCSPTLTKTDRKTFLKSKFGEKGEMLSNMELSKVGLSSSPKTTQYGYFELDYNE